MVEDGSPAMLPLADSGWEPLYREAASWVGVEEDVVDLGCGTGRLGHQLALNADRYGGYVGVDFSRAALDEADRYLAEHAPGLERELRHDDLRTWAPSPTRAGNCVYVCLETLEHLEDDVDLVRRVPPGHRLILSVPNYDSEAHLRTFRNASDLWERYGQLVTFRRWSLVDLGGDRWRVHLCDTVRRADSW